jgi:hypothetical protein
MKHWQFIQDHYDELPRILFKIGAIFDEKKPVIRKWGPKFVAAMTEYGHDHLDFIQCMCNPFRGEKYDPNREVPMNAFEWRREE